MHRHCVLFGDKNGMAKCTRKGSLAIQLVNSHWLPAWAVGTAHGAVVIRCMKVLPTSEST